MAHAPALLGYLPGRGVDAWEPGDFCGIGVAVPSPARRTLDDLLAAADRALYQAKRSGRDCVIMYADTRVPQASQPLPLARTSVLLG